MTRPLRIEFEGALYHVTSRGNERKKIFFTKRDYEKFREYLLEAKKKFGFIIQTTPRGHIWTLDKSNLAFFLKRRRCEMTRPLRIEKALWRY
ncbi:hypothetical protein LPW11_21855 [Geomonas sp. RF6]|uniref:hypothetical protein n=1 Tax=Geomonas sp. RF6 TaxID=2897342 RepID=UPI001E32F14A|nr:hypothetical protein [Geomonas sp. RF6]UFS70502.1 hypothetical protein LPW11_21855 [Geomonas sp. RF6]